MPITSSAPAPFIEMWDPARIPHIAISGRVGSGKSTALQQIIDHTTSTLAGEVRLIHGARLPQVATAGEHRNARTPADAAQLLEDVIADLTQRYAQLEKDSTTTLSPIVIVIDELETLLELSRVESDKGSLAREIGEQLTTIRSLGRSARIHLVTTSRKPLRSIGLPTDGVAQVALGRLTGTEAFHLSPAGSQLPTVDLPLGVGWLFTDGDDPQLISFPLTLRS